jgi:glycosyltransferase involved in cell wall biosynthesis
MKPELSVLMPAYNKGACIFESISLTIKTLKDLGIDHELIVINDGSGDQTCEECKKAMEKFANLKLVTYHNNSGKGHALKTGFYASSGEKIIFFDADLDYHPKQIKLFMDLMDEKNADVVIGSKRHRDSKVTYPFLRRFLSRGYQLFNTLLLGLPFSDTQPGIKLFKREVLEKVFPKVLIKRFAFDAELLLNSKKINYKIVESPIDLSFKRFPSSVNLNAIKSMFIDTCAIFYRDRILNYYEKVN